MTLREALEGAYAFLDLILAATRTANIAVNKMKSNCEIFGAATRLKELCREPGGTYGFAGGVRQEDLGTMLATNR